MQRTRERKPIKSREKYTLESVESFFPKGEWEGVPVPLGREDPAPSPNLTVIGGTKYDAQALTEYLSALPNTATVYVGKGMGVEAHLAKTDPRASVVELDEGRFGSRARAVNVPEVLVQDVSSPVILVGAGERVKQARSWLARANWGREVVTL